MMKRQKKTAVIHCRGGMVLREGIDRKMLPADCHDILNAYPDGIGLCSDGCLGGGSCMAACKLGAMTLNAAGLPEVVREKCVGCGLCARACPKHLIEIVPAENTIYAACASHAAAADARKQCGLSCIGCGICEKNCPAGAIHVEGGCAVIDPDRCIACGMCAMKCPREAIRDIRGIFTVS